MLTQENRLVFNYSENVFINFVPSCDMYRDRLPICFEFILVHRIRISAILSWVRNSYLTHVILPRLSWELFISCIETDAHGRQVKSLCQNDFMIIM